MAEWNERRFKIGLTLTICLAYCFPPEGGLGLDCAALRWPSSLLAGHVGNMFGETGFGFSLKNSWLLASSAVILLAGL